MPLLSQDQWNTLTSEEQEVLLKLGFSLREKIERRKKPRKKPYILESHSLCLLCDTETTTYWKMSPALRDGLLYWNSRKLSRSRLLIAKAYDIRKQPCCCQCKKTLLTWPKETLVTMLTTYAKFLAQKEAIKRSSTNKEYLVKTAHV